MGKIVLIMLAFTIPPVILLVFSYAMILSVLENEESQGSRFSLRFCSGKMIKNKDLAKEQADTLGMHHDTMTKEYFLEERPVYQKEIRPAEGGEMKDIESLNQDKLMGEREESIFLDDAYGNSDFNFTRTESRNLISRLKNRFVQMQIGVQARAVEKEERRIQEEIELYDQEELPEEIPNDFIGRLKYWWRNIFWFRVCSCALVVLFVFGVGFYSFQMRYPFQTNDLQPSVSENNETVEEFQNTKEEDILLDRFRHSLDEELAPIDVKADSLDSDPNLAEIVAVAQQSIGPTPENYTGSNTVSQPAGAIGSLSIPSINLKNAPVMGSVEMSDLAKGTGHFENTPVFDGNVGIAAHNNTYFKYLINVDIGDEIQYTVNGVTRTYQVTDMRAISDTDWGVFQEYGDNRLTLVTCEHLVPDRRIAVTAIQVGVDSGISNNKIFTGKVNSSLHQDSGDYHDAGSGYTNYIGIYTGNN